MVKYKTEGQFYQESQLICRTLAESAEDFIFVIDKDLRVQYVNLYAAGLLRKSPGVLIGRPLTECFSPEVSERMLNNLKRVFESGETLEIENDIMCPVSELWITTKLTPVVNEAGEVTSVLGISRDITKRKKVEEVMIKKNQEVESFVYTLSHDLKSPLVSLQGFTQLFAERNQDKIDAESRFFLKRIYANIEQMEELISDLLEFFRIGRIEGKIEPIVVKELFDYVIKFFEEVLKKNNIELQVNACDGCVVYGNSNQIRKALDNLISNAVKFMGDAKERKIELLCTWSGDSIIRLGVKDTGRGIDPKYHEKIFDVFYRLDTSRENVDSTGIGLAIVKKVMEEHEGLVWVNSEVDKGAEFWLEFPVPK